MSHPVTIMDGDSESGPRLGGRAPAGVRPSDAGLRYLLSLGFPWLPDHEVSVFVVADEGRLLHASGGLATKELLEVVLHPVRRRSEAPTSWDSGLSEHPLSIAAACSDLREIEGRWVPRSADKMGGRPYFIQGEPEREEPVMELLQRGYVQLLQVDVPAGGPASVLGSWPFGDALFHLFTRWENGAFEWEAFWEL
ncbi:MAG: hypothetical protein AAF533_15950 [Acidobacteriota bacterium]